MRNGQLVEQLFGCGNELLYFFVDRGASQAQQIGDRGVFLMCDISTLVGGGHELGRNGRVERNHMRQHQGVRPPVGYMKARSECVCQGVIDAHGGIREGDRSDAGCVVHHAACLFIMRMLIRDRQVLEDQPYRLHRVRVGVGRSVNRHCSFERMRQAVDAGIGRQHLRHRHHELRIDDGHVGSE